MAAYAVTEIKGRQWIDRESGSLVVYRRFTVQRPGGDEHAVEVEVSESGTPQHERCDCKGYTYHHGVCSHIEAVYAAGVLVCDCEA